MILTKNELITKEEPKQTNINNLLISIITVVYNGEKYLEQTIQSVINQTYKNVEYIIIDGASTDGTLDIIKKYEDYISYWLSEPDKGLYDAMNKGIKIASGKLIGMINSDDWYESTTIEEMVKAYIANPNKQIFHADRFDIDKNENRALNKFHPSEFKFKYYGMTYHHPSMFITREEYSKHLYNINLTALSDYQFIFETFLRDKESIYYLNKAVVNYRLEGVSAQIEINKKLKEGYEARKNAGMNFFENIFSIVLRAFVFYIHKLKRLLKNDI